MQCQYEAVQNLCPCACLALEDCTFTCDDSPTKAPTVISSINAVLPCECNTPSPNNSDPSAELSNLLMTLDVETISATLTEAAAERPDVEAMMADKSASQATEAKSSITGLVFLILLSVFCCCYCIATGVFTFIGVEGQELKIEKEDDRLKVYAYVACVGCFVFLLYLFYCIYFGL